MQYKTERLRTNVTFNNHLLLWKSNELCFVFYLFTLFFRLHYLYISYKTQDLRPFCSRLFHLVRNGDLNECHVRILCVINLHNNLSVSVHLTKICFILLGMAIMYFTDIWWLWMIWELNFIKSILLIDALWLFTENGVIPWTLRLVIMTEYTNTNFGLVITKFYPDIKNKFQKSKETGLIVCTFKRKHDK